MSNKNKNHEFLKSTGTGDIPLLNPEMEGGSFFWNGGEIGVLLIHGLTATTAEVWPLANRFHDAGLTVSGVLLPGHGTTPENLNQTSCTEWLAASEIAYLELKKNCSQIIKCSYCCRIKRVKLWQ